MYELRQNWVAQQLNKLLPPHFQHASDGRRIPRIGAKRAESVDRGCAPELVRFWGTSPAAGIARILDEFHPKSEDVFLGVGPGSGGIVCAMAQRRLRRVIGVNIDPQSAELARVNALRGTPVTISADDISTFTIPDDVTMMFLYAPLEAQVLRTFLLRLVYSFDRRPRAIRVAYANPDEHHAVLSVGRFQAIGRLPLESRSGRDSSIRTVQFYKVTPEQWVMALSPRMQQIGIVA